MCLCKKLLNIHNHDFVLLRRFNQDPL
jgi:hypothetical protein